jgi:hypothetical protein
MTIKVQVLVSPGCSHGASALELVSQVIGENAPEAEVETILVSTLEDASRWLFPGSPTVRVNGADIERPAPAGVGLA